MTYIRIYSRDDENRWDQYVEDHPHGTVFHRTSWKKVVEETFGHRSHYLFAEHREKIIGILPLFEIRSLLFGNYLISVPFAEFGGILSNHPKAEKALLDRAVFISKKNSISYLELRNKVEIPGLPKKELYFNFKKTIYADHEENLNSIPRKSRRMVRQGSRHGLTSEMGHHLLRVFYDLLALNYHRLGTPIFPKKMFIKFLEHFKDNSDILIVRSREGKPIAGVLSFFFKKQVIPYYAGSDFEHKLSAPNDFMYWELMKYGADHGFDVFDFGRSKVGTGSYDFKRHWGFKPDPLPYQYYLAQSGNRPNLSPSNPKYRKKIDMWRRLPLMVTKLLGPYIARSLA